MKGFESLFAIGTFLALAPLLHSGCCFRFALLPLLFFAPCALSTMLDLAIRVAILHFALLGAFFFVSTVFLASCPRKSRSHGHLVLVLRAFGLGLLCVTSRMGASFRACLVFLFCVPGLCSLLPIPLQALLRILHHQPQSRCECFCLCAATLLRSLEV